MSPKFCYATVLDVIISGNKGFWGWWGLESLLILLSSYNYCLSYRVHIYWNILQCTGIVRLLAGGRTASFQFTLRLLRTPWSLPAASTRNYFSSSRSIWVISSSELINFLLQNPKFPSPFLSLEQQEPLFTFLFRFLQMETDYLQGRLIHYSIETVYFNHIPSYQTQQPPLNTQPHTLQSHIFISIRG